MGIPKLVLIFRVLSWVSSVEQRSRRIDQYVIWPLWIWKRGTGFNHTCFKHPSTLSIHFAREWTAMHRSPLFCSENPRINISWLSQNCSTWFTRTQEKHRKFRKVVQLTLRCPAYLEWSTVSLLYHSELISYTVICNMCLLPRIRLLSSVAASNFFFLLQIQPFFAGCMFLKLSQITL